MNIYCDAYVCVYVYIEAHNTKMHRRQREDLLPVSGFRLSAGNF